MKSALKLDKNQKLRIQLRHQYSIERFGYHAHALFWSSQAIQEIRFKVFLDAIQSLTPSLPYSLLDVGCGFGDFKNYLSQQFQSCDYLGIDISPDVIFAGRCQYAGIELQEGEIFDFNWSEATFDWVVLSGALNEIVDAHGDYARGVIEEMYRLCRKGVAFNLLDARHASFQKCDDLQTFYPEEMSVFCQTFADEVELRTDYLDNDFTLILKKRMV